MSDEIHKQVLQTNKGRRICPEHRDSGKMREVPEGNWIHHKDAWVAIKTREAQAWTPEPWQKEPPDGYCLVIYGCDGKTVTLRAGDNPGDYNERHSLSESNLVRAMECVNACAGMADPEKEIAELQAKVSRLEALTDLQSRMLDGAIDDSAVDEKEIAALTAERDRLQAKLAQCEDHNKVLLEVLKSRSDRHLKPGGILTPNGDDYI